MEEDDTQPMEVQLSEDTRSVIDVSSRQSVPLNLSDRTTHVEVRTPAMKKQGKSRPASEGKTTAVNEGAGTSTDQVMDEADPAIQHLVHNLALCGSSSSMEKRGMVLEDDNLVNELELSFNPDLGEGYDPKVVFGENLPEMNTRGKKIRDLQSIIMCHAQNPDWIQTVAYPIHELPQDETDP
jgi:hypothetical protein